MDLKTFRQTIDALYDIGVSAHDANGEIVVTVYDSNEGYTLINELTIHENDACRLFGDLTVYSVDLRDRRMMFTLNAPEQEVQQSEDSAD